MKQRLSIAIAAVGLLLFSCTQKPKQQAEPQPQAAENVLPDFKMNHIGGGTLSVKEEMAKHKITVIDFWASWCGPCMREAPAMVEMYNAYKGKGLGIIGISLDENEQAWKEAVEHMNMNWTHISDLQGWNNAAAQMFGVSSIPFTIVVDSKGAILASGLRGEELSAFVASKLN